jgi:hypothetical protein
MKLAICTDVLRKLAFPEMLDLTMNVEAGLRTSSDAPEAAISK